jgi:hypothetical protein
MIGCRRATATGPAQPSADRQLACACSLQEPGTTGGQEVPGSDRWKASRLWRGKTLVLWWGYPACSNSVLPRKTFVGRPQMLFGYSLR